MLAALYGELVPHPWRDPESDTAAHSLFYHRSMAMGWLDDRSAGGGFNEHVIRAPGLWAMNDAGWNHPLGAAGTDLVSWFQVEASEVPGDRPLPVQPFLRCAQEATAWVGTLNLSAVQVLLPVQGLTPSSRPPYALVPAMRVKEWFAEGAPAARTPVRVHINSGQDPSIPALAPQLIDHLTGLEQDVFVVRSHDLAPDAVLPPPIADSAWNSPPLHGVELSGEIAEWSCDVVGWLAEVIADIAARLGVRAPLLVTVIRVSA
ncbi:hypothetical protein ABT336_19100 [Micromonospora sp. NPDC000207]|uniref:hypothetical protein n=1 Tax=Micromonospora sp. NPDC000207 TaxID=3154246 RepID=UPI00332A094A